MIMKDDRTIWDYFDMIQKINAEMQKQHQMADDYLNYLTATAAKIKDHASSKEKANIKMMGGNQGEVGPIKFTIDRNALSTLQSNHHQKVWPKNYFLSIHLLFFDLLGYS